ncbi:hypothetical protein [Halobacterium wangiae]|uniref:hypothetical protein n=1 Tax=Halobacterium wangiae TaxID=2902623 RepID=UPI001E3F541C|nr:hypothetical protein [Halobacterium wangiae]
MADLTEYQEKVIEAVTELDDVPMSVLYHAPTGPEMFIQNDPRDRSDFSPHVSLLAAYVFQVADGMDSNTNEILRAVDDQLREWNEGGIGVSAEHRGSE